MNRRDYERIRYNPNIQDYQRLQGSIKTKQRKQKVSVYIQIKKIHYSLRCLAFYLQNCLLTLS